MIGEIISLVDLYFNRRDGYNEKKQNFFTEIIDPAYSDFKFMHNYYLQAFQRYRDLINSSNEELSLKHKIFDEIWKDYLFSEGERSSLRNLSNKFSQGANDSVFLFFYEIYNYLTGLESNFHNNFRQDGFSSMVDTTSNVYFAMVDASLREILQQGIYDKKNAITALDEIVMDFQNRYISISNHYSEIRRSIFK